MSQYVTIHYAHGCTQYITICYITYNMFHNVYGCKAIYYNMLQYIKLMDVCNILQYVTLPTICFTMLMAVK